MTGIGSRSCDPHRSFGVFQPPRVPLDVISPVTIPDYSADYEPSPLVCDGSSVHPMDSLKKGPLVVDKLLVRQLLQVT